MHSKIVLGIHGVSFTQWLCTNCIILRIWFQLFNESQGDGFTVAKKKTGAVITGHCTCMAGYISDTSCLKQDSFQ